MIAVGPSDGKRSDWYKGEPGYGIASRDSNMLLWGPYKTVGYLKKAWGDRSPWLGNPAYASGQSSTRNPSFEYPPHSSPEYPGDGAGYASATRNPAGEEADFMGYGGSTVDYETKVYSYRGVEIRIPTHPDIFPPEEVVEEYSGGAPAVFSGYDLESAIEEIDEMAEEAPGAFLNPARHKHVAFGKEGADKRWGKSKASGSKKKAKKNPERSDMRSGACPECAANVVVPVGQSSGACGGCGTSLVVG